MGQPAFSLGVNFATETCIECGLPFAAPSGFFSERRNTHKSFYCPNGHSQYFAAKSDVEVLRERLAAEEQRKVAALERANEAEAKAAKVLRKLKRVGKGVCPECNRSFGDLARHMACKHPKSSRS